MNQARLSPPAVSRRDALKTFGASALALAASFAPGRLAAADEAKPAVPTGGPPPAPTGPFTLPPLGYAFEALEPGIDAATMQIHHDRHHKAYVDNANRALVGQAQLAGMSAEDILRNLRKVPGGSTHAAIRNNVGGHANHSLFWDILTPGGPKGPPGSLDGRITSDFGSFEAFVNKLGEAAMSRFGSGWAWLAVYNRKLTIMSTANQDSPLSDGATPVLGIDVWEHAYYLKYQNRRGEYVKNVFGLINWDKVAERFEAAMKTK
jgi:Fe-Mn family superoxide dismutase